MVKLIIVGITLLLTFCPDIQGSMIHRRSVLLFCRFQLPNFVIFFNANSINSIKEIIERRGSSSPWVQIRRSFRVRWSQLLCTVMWVMEDGLHMRTLTFPESNPSSRLSPSSCPTKKWQLKEVVWMTFDQWCEWLSIRSTRQPRHSTISDLFCKICSQFIECKRSLIRCFFFIPLVRKTSPFIWSLFIFLQCFHG